ncbi:hypothetical protein AHF37_10613 [Paragonimus kellicotti]|nr:hypothetical protein AHF37_10613 [Paragonimus kellicotti]
MVADFYRIRFQLDAVRKFGKECRMNVDTRTPFDLRRPSFFLNSRWNQKENLFSLSMSRDICMVIPVRYSIPFYADKMTQNNSKSTYDIPLAGKSTQLLVLQQFQNKLSRKCVRLFDDAVLQIPHLESTAQCDILFPSENMTLPTRTATTANKKMSTFKQELQGRIFSTGKSWRKGKSGLRSLRTRDFLEEYMSDSDIHSDDCSVDELNLSVIQEGEKNAAIFNQQTSSTKNVIDLEQPAFVGEAFNSSLARTKYPPAMNVPLKTSFLSELFAISNCVLDYYGETIGKTIRLKSADRNQKSCRNYLDCGKYERTSNKDDTITICDEQSSLASHTTMEFNLIEQDSWTVVQPTGTQSAAKLQPDSEKNEDGL